MSVGLGQIVSLEPVVEAAVNVGVRALAIIEADSANLPVKPPAYSVSLTRPGVLLPLHECSWISCSNWYVLSFCLHECCRCELALNEDNRTTFETGWPFIENTTTCETRIWNLRMQNDAWYAYAKNGQIFLFIEGLYQSNYKHHNWKFHWIIEGGSIRIWMWADEQIHVLFHASSRQPGTEILPHFQGVWAVTVPE